MLGFRNFTGVFTHKERRDYSHKILGTPRGIQVDGGPSGGFIVCRPGIELMFKLNKPDIKKNQSSNSM